MGLDENTKSFGKNLIIGGIVGICVGFVGGALAVRHCNPYFIEQQETVQTPYVPTKGMEISLRDLDNNGELETYLKLGDKEYAFILDENGHPVLKEYEVKKTDILLK